MTRRLFSVAFASSLAAFCACKKVGPTKDTNAVPVSALADIKVESPGHHHEHKAPHGGVLVEVGEEFAHVELVFDSNAGKLTAYILDGEAENPIRLPNRNIDIVVGKNKFTMVGVENPLTGEKVGDTSEFSLESPILKGQSAFEGMFPTLSIKGSAFREIVFKFPSSQTESH